MNIYIICNIDIKMATKNGLFCQICNKYIQTNNKQEYIQHLEQCNSNKLKELSKENDIPTSINNTNTINNNNNINIASFTFGGKQTEGILNNMILESASFNQSFKARKMSEENSYLNEENKFGLGISNKIGKHNSFMNSVLQLVWNMKALRNVILNEITIIEGNKSSFLYNLRVR